MNSKLTASQARARRERLAETPLVLLAVYYAVLIAAVMLLIYAFPQIWHGLSGGKLPGAVSVGGKHGDLSALAQSGNETAEGAGEPSGLPRAVAAALPMVAGTLIMLPVAGIYAVTRRRKPQVQATVQTMMILPAVVSGVVILVKNSLPLALSLAGIAAAINFRTRLRAPQDEVYVFLAIVIGLAAGLQVISIALAVSIVFNLIVIALTFTDFGRTEAALQSVPSRIPPAGPVALKSGSARSHSAAGDGGQTDHHGPPDGSATGKPLETVVRVYAAHPDAVRAKVESILTLGAKAWQFNRVLAEGEPGPGLEYQVRLRKKVPGPELIAQLQGSAAGEEIRAELA